MKSFATRLLSIAGLTATLMLLAPATRGEDNKKPSAAKAEESKKPATKAEDKAKAKSPTGKPKVEEPLTPLRDEQEFVFLGEARPVLVRLRVVVDGKPLTTAWHDFMKYLFAYLDVNKDGVLDKKEAERVVNGDQLTLGGIGLLAGGSSKGAMEALDANKDGKVTLEELEVYYRKNKFVPFQYQLNMSAPDPLAQLSYLGIRTDPDIASVSKSVFALLDTNKDGKITQAKLQAAQAILLERDENEDEILTTQELVTETKPGGSMAAMAMLGAARNNDATGKSFLLPILTPGQMPADLMKHALTRYAKAGKDKDKTKKLNRKDLGLDEKTFAQLDADKDGALDEKELAAFVKREPDVCLQFAFGDRKATGTLADSVSEVGRTALLSAALRQKQDNLVLLDLGKTRMELRHVEEEKHGSFFNDILRSQLSALFKAADKDGNGYVDAKEAKASPQFNRIYQSVDRDGDGKVSEKEMLAYYDQMQEIQKRARSACVTLVLKDQSRGLFDLLDTNRDGKLGLRELRQAPKLLERVAGQGKDYLAKDDVPHSYLLSLRRGTAQSDGLGAQEAIFDRVYGGYDDAEVQSLRGPGWFRKMDKNRDGDVSRKEFLFSDEQFRKLDTDGDGLISLEEAEKAGALSRK